jgi:hypothetical protein
VKLSPIFGEGIVMDSLNSMPDGPFTIDLEGESKQGALELLARIEEQFGAEFASSILDVVSKTCVAKSE